MTTPSPTDRLLLDAMLGKLATYLRMCGYDAAYALDRDIEDDGRILELARDEGRTLVTRDRELADRAENAIRVESKGIDDQLREVADAGLEFSAVEPSRCGSCNGELVRVDPSESTPERAPTPTEKAVWRCRDCGQHFWRGSHWEDVRDRLDELGVSS